MLTRKAELILEIASLERQIAVNDKAIEEADDRQSLRRRHGDSLYSRLLKAQYELERETAPLVKREPKGVQVGCYDI